MNRGRQNNDVLMALQASSTVQTSQLINELDMNAGFFDGGRCIVWKQEHTSMSLFGADIVRCL